MLAALEDFGALHIDLTLEDLSRPGLVSQMGVRAFRIDLSSALTGVSFQNAWAGRVTLELEGLTIPILDRAELARNNRATGRPKGRFDLDLLGEA